MPAPSTRNITPLIAGLVASDTLPLGVAVASGVAPMPTVSATRAVAVVEGFSPSGVIATLPLGVALASGVEPAEIIFPPAQSARLVITPGTASLADVSIRNISGTP